MSFYHDKKIVVRKYTDTKEGLMHKSDKYKNWGSERQIR